MYNKKWGTLSSFLLLLVSDWRAMAKEDFTISQPKHGTL